MTRTRVRIRFVAFPAVAQGSITGATIQTAAGFQVFIDSTRSREEQRHTIGHELAHIILGHFRAGPGADLARMEEQAEALADQLAPPYPLRGGTDRHPGLYLAFPPKLKYAPLPFLIENNKPE